jgi:ferredoxin
MDVDYEFIVLGSGPSSFAAVQILKDKQQSTLVLDIGKKHENTNLTIMKSDFVKDSGNLCKTKYLKILFKKSKSRIKFIPKPNFGSYYPYFDFKKLGIVKEKTSKLVLPISGGYGGFSTVWGATFERYPKDVIDQWKNELEINLTPYYLKLESEIPWINNSLLHPAFLSCITSKIPEKLENQIEINDINIAIDESDSHTKCIKCNLCLRGCPKDSIFNTSIYFENLWRKMNFKYKNNALVRKVELRNSVVFVEFLDLNDNKFKKVSCKHLFIGTGPVSTSNIILNSFEDIEKVEIKDSATSYMVGISWKKLPKIDYSNSLAKFVIDFKHDKEITTSSQVYNFTPGVFNAIYAKLFIPKFLQRRLDQLFQNRIVLIINYVDSRNSNSINIIKNSNNHYAKLIYSNSQKLIFRSLGLKINELLKSNGIYGVKFFHLVKETGYGVHFGSGFSPTGGLSTRTDKDLGTLKQSNSIHLIDSSVLPSIEPGSITLTIMANAMRIVENVCDKHNYR